VTYRTEQETFWAGNFGSEYIQRNQGDMLLASNLFFFTRALHRTRGIESCIEFGANIGMNLRALKLLNPNIDAHAIEINKEACGHLGTLIEPSKVYNKSILDFTPSTLRCDLVLIKGVLIHINPEALPNVYGKLVEACGRYLLIAEYYNPTPMTLLYRGHSNRLFKRDFAGEIMDRHPQLQLVDYGFMYHRDKNCPQDDISWFLMEKQSKF
jgi:pseudaminic acid biosynthesis-associated methylase